MCRVSSVVRVQRKAEESDEDEENESESESEDIDYEEESKKVFKVLTCARVCDSVSMHHVFLRVTHCCAVEGQGKAESEGKGKGQSQKLNQESAKEESEIEGGRFGF